VRPWQEGTPGKGSLTVEDRFNLTETLALKGRSSSGNDRLYEQIYAAYGSVSNTLARDVVAAVERAIPISIAKPTHINEFFMTGGLYSKPPAGDQRSELNWTLRLLKSGVTTSIFTALRGYNHDSHGASPMVRGAHLVRAQLEAVAQFLGELKGTPSPDRPGKTLFDDTLVLVTSEFGRTWPVGPNQDSAAGWQFYDDHNQMTSLILAGGAVNGNVNIGGYTNGGSQGIPIDIQGADGAIVKRPPLAVDIMATICSGFGMKPEQDFRYGGTYGVIPGLFRT
jgi:hypothetical protein